MLNRITTSRKCKVVCLGFFISNLSGCYLSKQGPQEALGIQTRGKVCPMFLVQQEPPSPVSEDLWWCTTTTGHHGYLSSASVQDQQRPATRKNGGKISSPHLTHNSYHNRHHGGSNNTPWKLPSVLRCWVRKLEHITSPADLKY